MVVLHVGQGLGQGLDIRQALVVQGTILLLLLLFLQLEPREQVDLDILLSAVAIPLATVPMPTPLVPTPILLVPIPIPLVPILPMPPTLVQECIPLTCTAAHQVQGHPPIRLSIRLGPKCIIPTPHSRIRPFMVPHLLTTALTHMVAITPTAVVEGTLVVEEEVVVVVTQVVVVVVTRVVVVVTVVVVVEEEIQVVAVVGEQTAKTIANQEYPLLTIPTSYCCHVAC